MTGATALARSFHPDAVYRRNKQAAKGVAQQVKPGLAARYFDDLLLFDDDRGRLKEGRAILTEARGRLRLSAFVARSRAGAA